MSTTPAPGIVIVGGGMVGAACALACAREGMRVTVVEPSVQASIGGGGATPLAMGHLVHLDDSPAQLALTRLGVRLWDQYADRLPPAVAYDQRGTLWLAEDDAQLALLREKAAVLGAEGIAAELLDESALYAAEPNLRPGLAGALHVAADRTVDPGEAARFVINEAQAGGARWVIGRATALSPEGSVLLADGTHLAAGRVVFATGAYAPDLLPGLPVRPRQGHLLLAAAPGPDFVRHQLVELGYLASAHGNTDDVSVAFNVQPRQGNRVLIGSSRQFDRTDPVVDSDVMARMLARAETFLPGVASLARLTRWTGLRAVTPDRLPILGPHPTTEGVYVANGFEGLGITTALAAAELLVAQMTGQTPPLPVAPYLPSRFVAPASA